VPILTPDILDFTSHSAEQTARIGVRLGGLLMPGDVVCLSGELGAGKTALAAGIGKGWGVLEQVNSPTFVFIHEHRRAIDAVRLYHVDCYRLPDAENASTIGLDEILAGDDVAIIEWPERIEALLPDARLWIHLTVFDDYTEKRQVQFRASGNRYQTLLDTFRRKAFGA
jgi:tRNA threonylcarbamoyladenosine biosynthesis protein TsaE